MRYVSLVHASQLPLVRLQSDILLDSSLTDVMSGLYIGATENSGVEMNDIACFRNCWV